MRQPVLMKDMMARTGGELPTKSLKTYGFNSKFGQVSSTRVKLKIRKSVSPASTNNYHSYKQNAIASTSIGSKK